MCIRNIYMYNTCTLIIAGLHRKLQFEDYNTSFSYMQEYVQYCKSSLMMYLNDFQKYNSQAGMNVQPPPPPSMIPCVVCTLLQFQYCFFSLKITAHPSVIEHCHKLSELGWLYRRINKYVEAKTQDPSLGLVVQVGVYNHTCTCTCVYYVYKQCICLCVYMYLMTVYMYIRDM